MLILRTKRIQIVTTRQQLQHVIEIAPTFPKWQDIEAVDSQHLTLERTNINKTPLDINIQIERQSLWITNQ